jgi:hypothetical protein
MSPAPKKTAKFGFVSARRSAWLIGALALGASVACSSSDEPGNSGTAGALPGSAGASAGGTAVAGAPAGGSQAVAGAGNTGGAIGSAGAGATGGSSAGAGNAASGGTSAGGPGAGGSAGSGTAGNGTAGSGTAGSGTAGTGAGGAGAFAPCPTTGPCKILPFGDSITFGLLYPDYSTPKQGGYRAQIFTKAVAANQNITFLGSQSSGPAMVAGKPFPQKNEGRSGWTIEPGGGSPGGISSLVPTPAFSTIPDIVLLMIGTNDAGKSLTAQQMADNLGKLMDSVISTAPNALLVVSKIPPLSTQQAKIDSYNEKIPGLVQTRAAAGKHVLAVDNKLTASDMTGDNVHPNEGGYVKLGDNWYEAIKGYLRTGT